ncbi:hypothetical protein EWM64_g2937 [Hericium alpestre]|uniref:Fungal-type protein kinase domain-containing protein n=1 Tax=Hericium alpestre TaxID=135208 RepID=A0A4Z0A2V8_9AGAM|nr:hypothetical protein EWM64_g2937 [Hericium alpestre]
MAIQVEQLVEQRKRKRQPDSAYTLIGRSLYHADGIVKLKICRKLSQIDVSTENMFGLTEISVAGDIHSTSNKAQRSLIRPVSPQYLSHIESSEEFKYIFLQLVRFFMRDEKGTPSSFLNDWDAAKPVPSDETYHMLAAHQRTGIVPFMAIDLLCEDPPPHLYRHDLESFMYILIWCAIHFSLNGSQAQCIHKAVESWIHGTWATIGSQKGQFFVSQAAQYRKSMYDAITPAFRPAQKWTQRLILMSNDGSRARMDRTDILERLELEDDVEAPDVWDEDTLNGTVTYEKFMAAIGEDPRITELDG